MGNSRSHLTTQQLHTEITELRHRIKNSWLQKNRLQSQLAELRALHRRKNSLFVAVEQCLSRTDTVLWPRIATLAACAEEECATWPEHSMVASLAAAHAVSNSLWSEALTADRLIVFRDSEVSKLRECLNTLDERLQDVDGTYRGLQQRVVQFADQLLAQLAVLELELATADIDRVTGLKFSQLTPLAQLKTICMQQQQVLERWISSGLVQWELSLLEEALNATKEALARQQERAPISLAQVSLPAICPSVVECMVWPTSLPQQLEVLAHTLMSCPRVECCGCAGPAKRGKKRLLQLEQACGTVEWFAGSDRKHRFDHQTTQVLEATFRAEDGRLIHVLSTELDCDGLPAFDLVIDLDKMTQTSVLTGEISPVARGDDVQEGCSTGDTTMVSKHRPVIHLERGPSFSAGVAHVQHELAARRSVAEHLPCPTVAQAELEAMDEDAQLLHVLRATNPTTAYEQMDSDQSLQLRQDVLEQIRFRRRQLLGPAAISGCVGAATSPHHSCSLCNGTGSHTALLAPEQPMAAAECIAPPLCGVCYSMPGEFKMSRNCPAAHFLCRECIASTVDAAVESGHFPLHCPCCRAAAWGVNGQADSELHELGLIDKDSISFLEWNGVISLELGVRFVKAAGLLTAAVSACSSGCGRYLYDEHSLYRNPLYKCQIGEGVEDASGGWQGVRLGVCACGAIQCPKCQSVICKEQFDTHMCKEATATLDVVSRNLMSQTCKRCPGCGMFLEKADGCDIMMCGDTAHGSVRNALRNGGCSFIFNWDTMEEIDDTYDGVHGAKVYGKAPWTERQVLKQRPMHYAEAEAVQVYGVLVVPSRLS